MLFLWPQHTWGKRLRGNSRSTAEMTFLSHECLCLSQMIPESITESQATVLRSCWCVVILHVQLSIP